MKPIVLMDDGLIDFFVVNPDVSRWEAVMAEYRLKKAYDFRETEERIYAWWEENGYFTPQIEPDRKPYVISIPPPNVTGELHLGHAMFVAMEDLMIRHARMSGNPTLWVPGSDHAGIATQLQMERALKEQGTSREEIGREEFIRQTWEWKEKYGGIITQQLRRLGASCDWTRERFTLDEGLSLAVREAFVQLYEKGLIYRGSYLINWSPGLQTAVSDLEVEYSEEQGTLYYFKYPIADSDEYIPVATTRPETILGDTAVAIHPEDDRYRHLIGKTCLVPILKRTIPVIHDTYVDLEFGTGALKITPGHDPSDYEIGLRHGLMIINVLNEDATMNENAGPYEGTDRFECRERLWADMEAEGLVIKTEPYLLQVPRTQRGGEIVEPLVSTQWFVKMQPLAEPALDAVREGRIRIVPDRFSKVYFNWLENIRDWCISRQLWWGHRIPAWYCGDCDGITVAKEEPDQCAHCESEHLEQDPDVLDTWFSSGLWPFSTLGWPEKTEDYDYFYPTTMMETGYDILFFWVARMIMMGLEFTGVEPFEYVYLHGLVRDEHGRKMSKTLGNVIDPLQLMDELGADALRFTLLTGSTPGQDMKLSVDKIEANRNFANKIWNAGRFILNNLENVPPQPEDEVPPTLADQWILARMQEIILGVDRLIGAFQYGEAGRQIYEFFWGDFADWYIEIAKLQIDNGAERAWSTIHILVEVYDRCLRMLHPYIPFVTEELWGHLKQACLEQGISNGTGSEWEQALIVASWPTAEPINTSQENALADFKKLRDVVSAIRNVRQSRGVEPRRQIGAILESSSDYELLRESQQAISALAGIDPENLRIESGAVQPPEDAVPLVVGGINAYLPIEGLFDAEQERSRLNAQLKEARSQIERLEALLAGPFVEKAPPEVVEAEKNRLHGWKESEANILIQLEQLN